MRHAAEVLAAALDDLATAIASQYPHLGDVSVDEPVAVLAAFAHDHQHEPVHLPAAD